jgi:hypothetical protein
MKRYYEDSEYVIPFDQVVFCQWADELGEMVLKVNFASVQGGDSFWRLSLTGRRAEVFLRDYKNWLGQ